MALTIGRRGLPGNSSLAKLLEEERGVRNPRNLPWLTVARILEWADLHKNRTGEWPNLSSGRVLGTDDTWAGINHSLWAGRRGLPGGTSMAILLAEHRGVRNLSDLPPLTEELILAWADAHRERTGEWPNIQSGAIDDASGEKWANVNAALQTGGRGLPGNSSLAKLMQERRGVRNVGNLPSLTEAQILEWADTHKNRTADWPTKMSGPIADAPGETWANVNVALSQGGRDLPGGWTLAKFLEERRGVPHIFNRPVTEEQILVWADSHKDRTGKWPTVKSGPIFEVPGETWLGIYHALRKGVRNLPGGSSLAQLLDERRGVRNKQDLTPLTEEQILQWLDSHKLRTGRWPTKQSGPISDAPGETWANVNAALVQGLRTLPGGSSLARLLAENRNARNTHTITQLTVDQILNWADEHHRRTGTWPKAASGIIPEVPGESWSNINAALVQGRRNLPGDSSLAQLLAENRSVRNHLDLPAVTEDQILAWADAHHERTGEWPKVNSGPIHDVPGEKWANIDQSLAKGLRGLLEGSSLAKLLDQSRAVRNRSGLGPLTLEQILRWADLHRQRTGLWPNYLSGSIVDAAGETWSAIQHLLQRGSRGLPGGSSLARLLKEHRSDTTT